MILHLYLISLLPKLCHRPFSSSSSVSIHDAFLPVVLTLIDFFILTYTTKSIASFTHPTIHPAIHSFIHLSIHIS